jgi:hypothetical protein
MSHEVTIGDLRAGGWSVPDFDTVWRGLDPAQVSRFISQLHSDVDQAISGYEAALAVAEEERQRLEAELERLRMSSGAESAEPTAEAEPEPATPSARRERSAASVVA